jgi:chemotaxis protein methyltransferase CheR
MKATIPTVPGPLLQQVSERIECLTGLYFPGERFADLERGLAQAAREFGNLDTRAYVEVLLSRNVNAADLEALAGSLTIGETHFFRDPSVFTFLESTLLPDLIAARRGRNQRLRIWSAGCASGEEPYSIAILLHRLLPDLSDWQIAILGTDINPKVLARAAAGVYTEWSFRDTPAWVKPRYFTATSGRYEIQSTIKRMVRFACLNLVEDVYPSVLNNTNGLDLIVCRNVLLYFAPARIPPVVQRFHGALTAGGQLVMGAVEASLMTFPGFTPVPAPGVSLYRRNQSSVISDRASVISPSDRPPVTDHQPPVTDHRQSATDHRQSATDHRSPITDPQSLFAAGRYGEARAALLGGAGRRPDNDPQLAGLLAQCHANLGELAEALLWCERALEMAKTDPALHFLRAGILQELQRDDEALLALRNVLFLDAGHVLAHFSMANLHRRADRLSVAAKHTANVRRLLEHRDESEELPQSGGLTVGRLNAILATTAWP